MGTAHRVVAWCVAATEGVSEQMHQRIRKLGDMVTVGTLARTLSLTDCMAVTSAAFAAPTEPETLTNALFRPSDCEFCHRYNNASDHVSDPPYSPLDTWQGSLMANAARDPVFWAALAVADADAPGETELCVRCHAPRAFLAGHGDVTSMDELEPEERDGVECEVCHRMMEDPGTPAGNAMYRIDDVMVEGNVPRRGPWTYSDDPEAPQPAHSWIQDPYTGSSRLCGTCHDVTTTAERVDDDGVGMGTPFNEQRTYSEWLGSAYAQEGSDFRSCQDCHMSAVADMSGCLALLDRASHPVGGRRHSLVGANRFMTELLQNIYGSAGTREVSDTFFDTALAAMDALLPTSATLEVAAPSAVDLEAGLADLTVTVTNKTGHKLPSGYSEGRVMWLEVTLHHGDTLLTSSGLWDQTDGIEHDEQLRTYEAHAEDHADGTVFHLLRNNHWVLDTRIPPLGLTPNVETDPVGERYTLLEDGTWPNFDTHTYAFSGFPAVVDPTPEDTSDDILRVTVRLRYLINTPAYITFLGASAGEAGAHVAGLFDDAGGATPLTLAEEVIDVPISRFAGGSATNTGDATGTSTTASSPIHTSTTASGDTDATGTGTEQHGSGGGCACNSAPASGATWLLLVTLPLWRKRRAS